jgi:hypothetical protein
MKIIIARSIFYLWPDFIIFKIRKKYRLLVEKYFPSKKTKFEEKKNI